MRITTGPDAETDFRVVLQGGKHWFYCGDMYAANGTYQHFFHRAPNSVSIEDRWLQHVASPLAPNDISPNEMKYHSDEIRKIIEELGFEKALNYFTNQCEFNSERSGNHIPWWIHKKIMDLLERVGFSKSYRLG